jgi:hypothetical protein
LKAFFFEKMTTLGGIELDKDFFACLHLSTRKTFGHEHVRATETHHDSELDCSLPDATLWNNAQILMIGIIKFLAQFLFLQTGK